MLPAVDRMVRELTTTMDATLSQHFIATTVADQVVEAMIPRFQQVPEGRGAIVLGTARGDFHGLGRKIVGGCLKAHLFTVHDLGLNVAPERFVDEAVARGASVIGVSSMMVHTATGEAGPRGVRAVLRERGLESRIKLVVGGAPYRFDADLWRTVGADGWGENGAVAAQLAGRLVEQVARQAADQAVGQDVGEAGRD